MIDVIIPTCNRPHLLPGLLQALERQTLRPNRVVISDSSDSVVTRSQVNWSIEIIHIACPRKSLAFQRNLGVEELVAQGDPPDYVAFLDDDVLPTSNYLEELSDFLSQRGQWAVGCSGVDGHGRRPASRIARPVLRLFLLDSLREGKVLRSGFNTAVTRSETAVKTDWLIGCSMWRFSILENLRFRDDFEGSSLGEDVEFSYRAGRLGALFVLPGVRLGHSLDPSGRPDSFLHHYRLLRSRAEIAKLRSPLWLAWLGFLWGAVGQIVVTAATCLIALKRGSGMGWDPLRGALAGVWGALRGTQMR